MLKDTKIYKIKNKLNDYFKFNKFVEYNLLNGGVFLNLISLQIPVILPGI